jgi:hypothetical protein
MKRFHIYLMVGCLILYGWFFIVPVFFSGQTMMFYRYIYTMPTIGADLSQMLVYSSSWIHGKSAYIGNNLYPPLATALFTPLLLVDSSFAYLIVTIFTLCCFAFITFYLPFIQFRAFMPALVILSTGLFSYGLQFEIERGQFNVIAMTLCLSGLWIFHKLPRYRGLSYVLFTLAVQLKVYPMLFIIMFIKETDLKSNIRRLILLSAANIALLFVLGITTFYEFMHSIQSQMSDPNSWWGNHSIQSFLVFVQKYYDPTFNKDSWQIILFLGVITLIGVMFWRYRTNPFNPSFLLACTIGAMLLPSVSHDYKLSILCAPMAMLFAEQQEKMNPWLLFIYASMLFSYSFKPMFLWNNLPALFAMLVILTWTNRHDTQPRLADTKTKTKAYRQR